MSSLLQFEGKIDKKGIHLMALKKRADDNYNILYDESFEEMYECKCGKKHPVIYTFVRKPKGMFGCWVVFRWNNTDHIPDLSTPMSLKPNERPKDMKRMTNDDCSKYWHS